MFKTLLLTLVASVLSVSAFAADLTKMREQMFDPVIQLGNYCSGMIVHSDRLYKSGKVKTYVLTAKHCIDSPHKRIDIKVAKHNRTNRLVSEINYLAEVADQSSTSDLALIKLLDNETLFPTVKLAPKEVSTELTFGQDVYSVSYPLGLSKVYSEGFLGFVQNVKPNNKSLNSRSGDFYRATPDVAPASSGSPLFRKTAEGNYEVIGVLTAQYTPAWFINLYTPVEEVIDYIERNKKIFTVEE